MPATRGKSYQLSKITNDSASGERGNIMLGVRKCGPESRHHWQPWPLVPSPCMGSHCVHHHGHHSLYAHCTQSICHVSYLLCPPSVRPTVPTMPAVPSTVSMHTLPSVLITTTSPAITIPAVPSVLLLSVSTIPAMFSPLVYPSV